MNRLINDRNPKLYVLAKKLGRALLTTSMREHVAALAIIVIMTVLVCRNLILSSSPAMGTLGSEFTISWSTRNFEGYYIWTSQFLGFTQIFSLQHLLTAINIVLQNPPLTINIFILVFFAFSGLSMYYFTRHHLKKFTPSIISAIVFMMGQWHMGQLMSGNLTRTIIYAFLPLSFLLLDFLLIRKNFKFVIPFSLTLCIVTFLGRLDAIIYFLPFLFLRSLLTLAIPPKGSNRKVIGIRLIKIWVVSATLFIAFGSFQLIPTLFGVKPPYVSFSQVFDLEELWNLDIFDSMLAFGRELGLLYQFGEIKWDYHPFLNLLQYRLISMIVPIVAFSSLLKVRKRRIELFFGLAAVLSIFLSKGIFPPFGNIYEWMFNNLPGIGVIRAPNRWTMITWFSYAFLIAVTLERITYSIKIKNDYVIGIGRIKRLIGSKTVVNDFSSFFVLNKKNIKICQGVGTAIIITMLLISVSVGSYFALTTGIPTWEPSPRHQEPYLWMAEKPGDFRITATPFYQGGMRVIGDQILLDKSPELGAGFWEYDLGSYNSHLSKKPVFGRPNPNFNVYSGDFAMFTSNIVNNRKTDYFSKIVGIGDVKYIVDQSYTTTEERAFFTEQEGLTPVFDNNDSIIYENTYWMPRITSPPNSALVIGGREAFIMLSEIEGFDFRNWGLFFADQIIRESGKEYFFNLLNASSMIFLVNNDLLDLAILTIENVTRVVAVKYSYPSTDKEHHWVSSDSATSIGKLVLNSRTLSTSGSNNVSIPLTVNDDGEYEVWIRILYGTERGSLEVYIDNERVGSILPQLENSEELKWTKALSTSLEKGQHTLMLKNSMSEFGISNDIDEIMLVKEGEVNRSLNEVINIIQQERVNTIFFLDRDAISLFDYGSDVLTNFGTDSIMLNHTLTVTRGIEKLGYRDFDFTIVNNNQTEFWVNLNPAGTKLSDEPTNATVSKSHNSLKIDISSNRNERSFALIEKKYDTPQNFSDYLYFALWFRGQNTKTTFPFLFYFDTSWENWVAFRISDESIDWRRFVFTLSNPDNQLGEPDWDNVCSIRLGNNYNITGEYYIDYIGLYKDAFEKISYNPSPVEFIKKVETTSENTISYQRINPTKYIVNVEVVDSTFLILSEAYHPLWKAYVDGEELNSIISYSFINGFHITKNGEYDITIEFIGQRYVTYGSIISVASIILPITYLIFGVKINRFINKKLKLRWKRET